MKTFIAALMLISSSAVFAWGNTGHRVVGDVAARFLDIGILVKAHKLLKGQSLSHVATRRMKLNQNQQLISIRTTGTTRHGRLMIMITMRALKPQRLVYF